MKISSQRFLDQDTVNEKAAAKDFTVSVSPVFEIDGEEFEVVIDGHHSFAAAKQAGVEPDFVTIDQSECDAINLLEAGDTDGFLMAVHHSDNYYDIETGIEVW